MKHGGNRTTSAPGSPPGARPSGRRDVRLERRRWITSALPARLPLLRRKRRAPAGARPSGRRDVRMEQKRRKTQALSVLVLPLRRKRRAPAALRGSVICTDGTRFPRRRTLECGDLSPLSRRRLVAVEARHASEPARTPPLARAVNAPLRTHAPRTSTATSRLGKAVTSHRTPKRALRFRHASFHSSPCHRAA